MDFFANKKYILYFLLLTIIVYICYKISISEKFKAIKRLCCLTEQQVESFLNSYDKIFNDQSMISTLQDYKDGKPPARFIIPEQDKTADYTADCYSILIDLCTLGNVQKMYIPMVMDINKSLPENQCLWEQKLANDLNVKPGSKILDIGCGAGIIANDVSFYTNSTVYGINIDNKQLQQAKELAKKNKTNNEFFYQDSNSKYDFPDNYFDAIYVVQAMLTFIHNLDVFKELYRILKPGGKVYIQDGLLLDNFDKNNKHHMKLMKNSRQVMEGVVFRHYKYYEDMIADAGFKLLVSKPNNCCPLLIREHQHYDLIENITNTLVKYKVIPEYIDKLMQRLRFGAEDLIEMEKDKLLTMTYDFYFEKPLKPISLPKTTTLQPNSDIENDNTKSDKEKDKTESEPDKDKTE